jgi:CheY-like chemotaxis protein/phosphotransferase system HPr-like phosphotransfer protein
MAQNQTPSALRLPPTDQFVVLIQDAHANPEGQQNVARMLHYLEAKFPGLAVGLEGAVGELHPENLDLFKKYPEANRAVIEDLKQKGELNGAELFLIEQHSATRNGQRATEDQNSLSVERRSLRAPVVRGVETPALYRDNLRTYRDLLSHRDEIGTLLVPIRAQLEKESSQKLNGELRDFLKERSRRKEGRFEASAAQSDPNLQAYVRYLQKQALKLLQVDLKDPIEQLRFPSLLRVVMIEEAHKGFDAQKAKSEWGEVLQTIQSAVRDTDERSFVQEFEAFANNRGFLEESGRGRKSAEEMGATHNAQRATESKKTLSVERNTLRAPVFQGAEIPALYPRKLLEGFFRFAKKHQLSFNGKEAFWQSWKLAVFQAEIDVTELLKEMNVLENGLIQKLVRSEVEKALARKIGDLELLEKLLRLELSREEYDKALLERAAIEDLFQEPDAKSKSLKSFCDKAYHFYDVSLRRDEALVENLLNATEGGGQRAEGGKTDAPSTIHHPLSRISVLYTGGFHAPGMEAILRGKGIGYAVISPRITKTDHGEMYQKVISDANADVSAYFKVKNPFLTKQEALLFKQLIETGAPALSEKYHLKPNEVAQSVAQAVSSSPVFSGTLRADQTQADPSVVRFTPEANSQISTPRNSSVMAIPSATIGRAEARLLDPEMQRATGQTAVVNFSAGISTVLRPETHTVIGNLDVTSGTISGGRAEVREEGMETKAGSVIEVEPLYANMRPLVFRENTHWPEILDYLKRMAAGLKDGLPTEAARGFVEQLQRGLRTVRDSRLLLGKETCVHCASSGMCGALSAFRMMQKSGVRDLSLPAEKESPNAKHPTITNAEIELALSGLTPLAAVLTRPAEKSEVAAEFEAKVQQLPVGEVRSEIRDEPRPALNMTVNYTRAFYKELSGKSQAEQEDLLGQIYDWLDGVQKTTEVRGLGETYKGGLAGYRKLRWGRNLRIVFRYDIHRRFSLSDPRRREVTLVHCLRKGEYEGPQDGLVRDIQAASIDILKPNDEDKNRLDNRLYNLGPVIAVDRTTTAFIKQRRSRGLLIGALGSVADMKGVAGIFTQSDTGTGADGAGQAAQVFLPVKDMQDALETASYDPAKAVGLWLGKDGQVPAEELEAAELLLKKWMEVEVRFLRLIEANLKQDKPGFEDIAFFYFEVAGNVLKARILKKIVAWAKRQPETAEGLEQIRSAYDVLKKPREGEAVFQNSELDTLIEERAEQSLIAAATREPVATVAMTAVEGPDKTTVPSVIDKTPLAAPVPAPESSLAALLTLPDTAEFRAALETVKGILPTEGVSQRFTTVENGKALLTVVSDLRRSNTSVWTDLGRLTGLSPKAKNLKSLRAQLEEICFPFIDLDQIPATFKILYLDKFLESGRKAFADADIEKAAKWAALAEAVKAPEASGEAREVPEYVRQQFLKLKANAVELTEDIRAAREWLDLVFNGISSKGAGAQEKFEKMSALWMKWIPERQTAVLNILMSRRHLDELKARKSNVPFVATYLRPFFLSGEGNIELGGSQIGRLLSVLSMEDLLAAVIVLRVMQDAGALAREALTQIVFSGISGIPGAATSLHVVNQSDRSTTAVGVAPVHKEAAIPSILTQALVKRTLGMDWDLPVVMQIQDAARGRTFADKAAAVRFIAETNEKLSGENGDKTGSAVRSETRETPSDDALKTIVFELVKLVQRPEAPGIHFGLLVSDPGEMVSRAEEIIKAIKGKDLWRAKGLTFEWMNVLEEGVWGAAGFENLRLLAEKLSEIGLMDTKFLDTFKALLLRKAHVLRAPSDPKAKTQKIDLDAVFAPGRSEVRQESSFPVVESSPKNATAAGRAFIFSPKTDTALLLTSDQGPVKEVLKRFEVLVREIVQEMDVPVDQAIKKAGQGDRTALINDLRRVFSHDAAEALREVQRKAAGRDGLVSSPYGLLEAKLIAEFKKCKASAKEGARARVECLQFLLSHYREKAGLLAKLVSAEVTDEVQKIEIANKQYQDMLLVVSRYMKRFSRMIRQEEARDTRAREFIARIHASEDEILLGIVEQVKTIRERIKELMGAKKQISYDDPQGAKKRKEIDDESKLLKEKLALATQQLRDRVKEKRLDDARSQKVLAYLDAWTRLDLGFPTVLGNLRDAVEGTISEKGFSGGGDSQREKLLARMVKQNRNLASLFFEDVLIPGRRVAAGMKGGNEVAQGYEDMLAIIQEVLAELMQQEETFEIRTDGKASKGGVTLVCENPPTPRQYREIRRRLGASLTGIFVMGDVANAVAHLKIAMQADMEPPVLTLLDREHFQRLREVIQSEGPEDAPMIVVEVVPVQQDGQILQQQRVFIHPSHEHLVLYEAQRKKEKLKESALRRWAREPFPESVLDKLAVNLMPGHLDVLGKILQGTGLKKIAIGLYRTELMKKDMETALCRMIDSLASSLGKVPASLNGRPDAAGLLEKEIRDLLDGESGVSVRQVMALMEEDARGLIHHPLISVARIRAPDLRMDKNEKIYETLGAHDLVQDEDKDSGFDMYYTPFGRLLLTLYIASVLKADAESTQKERAGLEFIFPMVRTPADIAYIKEIILPVAMKLAAEGLGGVEGSTDATQRIAASKKRIPFGMMIENQDAKKNLIHFLKDDFLEVFSFGLNDFLVESVAARLGVRVDRTDVLFRHFAGRWDDPFKEEVDQTVAMFDYYNRSTTGLKKRLCFCGEAAAEPFFGEYTELLEQKDPSVGLSRSMSPGRILENLFYLVNIQAMSRRSLANVFQQNPSPIPVEVRLAALLEFMIIAEEKQLKYEHNGFSLALQRLDTDVVEGTGSADEYILLKKQVRAFLSFLGRHAELNTMDLAPGDEIARDELDRILKWMVWQKFLFAEDRLELLAAFDFLGPVRRVFLDERRKSPGGPYAKDLDPDLAEPFLGLLREKHKDRNYPGTVPGFYEAYFRHQAVTRYTLARAEQELRSQLSPSEYSEEYKALRTIDDGRRGKRVVKVLTRTGDGTAEETGTAYRGSSPVIFIPNGNDGLFKRHPQLLLEIFADAVAASARIGHYVQRELIQGWRKLAKVKVLPASLKGSFRQSFREIFGMNAKNKYSVVRMHRFGVFDRLIKGYKKMRGRFPAEGSRRYTEDKLMTRTYELLEDLYDADHTAFERVRVVFRAARADPDQVTALRLAVILEPVILQHFTREEILRSNDPGLLKGQVAEALGELGLDSDPELMGRIQWLVFWHIHLASTDLLNKQQFINRLEMIIEAQRSREDGLSLISLLYAMTMANRAAYVDPEDLALLLRSGMRSPLASWDIFFSALMDFLLHEISGVPMRLDETLEIAGQKVRDDEWNIPGKERMPTQERVFELIQGKKVPVPAALQRFLGGPGADNVERKEAIAGLCRAYLTPVSEHYARALKDAELLGQLDHLVQVQNLASEENYEKIPVLFQPISRQYNQSYQVLIGVGALLPGAQKIFFETLARHGFFIERAMPRHNADGSEVISFLGSFPHEVENVDAEIAQITSDLQIIFARQHPSLYNAMLPLFTGVRGWKSLLFQRAHRHFQKSLIVRHPKKWMGGRKTGVFFGADTADATELSVETADRIGLFAAIATFLEQNRDLEILDYEIDDTQGFYLKMFFKVRRLGTTEPLRSGDKQRIKDEMEPLLDASAVVIGGEGVTILEEEEPSAPSSGSAAPAPDAAPAPEVPGAETAPVISREMESLPGGLFRMGKVFEIKTEFGLHLRPAAKIAKILERFPSISKAGAWKSGMGWKDAKNMNKLMQLEGAQGEKISIILEGSSTEDIRAAFVSIVNEILEDQEDNKSVFEEARSELRAGVPEAVRHAVISGPVAAGERLFRTRERPLARSEAREEVVNLNDMKVEHKTGTAALLPEWGFWEVNNGAIQGREKSHERPGTAASDFKRRLEGLRTKPIKGMSLGVLIQDEMGKNLGFVGVGAKSEASVIFTTIGKLIKPGFQIEVQNAWVKGTRPAEGFLGLGKLLGSTESVQYSVILVTLKSRSEVRNVPETVKAVVKDIVEQLAAQKIRYQGKRSLEDGNATPEVQAQDYLLREIRYYLYNKPRKDSVFVDALLADLNPEQDPSNISSALAEVSSYLGQVIDDFDFKRIWDGIKAMDLASVKREGTIVSGQTRVRDVPVLLEVNVSDMESGTVTEAKPVVITEKRSGRITLSTTRVAQSELIYLDVINILKRAAAVSGEKTIRPDAVRSEMRDDQTEAPVVRPLDMPADQAARIGKIFVVGYQPGQESLTEDAMLYPWFIRAMLEKFPNAKIHMAIDNPNLFSSEHYKGRVFTVVDPSYKSKGEAPNGVLDKIQAEDGIMGDMLIGMPDGLVRWLRSQDYDLVFDFTKCETGLEVPFTEIYEKATAGTQPRLPVLFLNMNPLQKNPVTGLPNPSMALMLDKSGLKRVQGTENLTRKTSKSKDPVYWEMILRIYRELGLFKKDVDLQSLTVKLPDESGRRRTQNMLAAIFAQQGLSKDEALRVVEGRRKFVYVNTFSRSHPGLTKPSVWIDMLSEVLENNDAYFIFSQGAVREDQKLRYKMEEVIRTLAQKYPAKADRLLRAPENLLISDVQELMRVADLVLTPESGFSPLATAQNVPQVLVVSGDPGRSLMKPFWEHSLVAGKESVTAPMVTDFIAEVLDPTIPPARYPILGITTLQERTQTKDRPEDFFKKVLVVEDHYSIRLMMRSFLQSIGITNVKLAENGEEAQKLYEQAASTAKPFNLMFVDLDLGPGMTGEEFVRKMGPINTGVVFMSETFSLSGVYKYTERLKEQVAAAVLKKPFTDEAFQRLFEDLTAQKIAKEGSASGVRSEVRGPRKVLVVDDEPSIVLTVRTYLAFGVDDPPEVLVASSFEEARSLLEKNPDIDFGYFDVHFGSNVHGGHELALEIRKTRNMPFIFSSGDALALENEEWKEKLRRANVVFGNLQKPILSQEQFLAAIKKAWESRSEVRISGTKEYEASLSSATSAVDLLSVPAEIIAVSEQLGTVYSAQDIAAGLEGGVTETNVRKARLWITMKLLETMSDSKREGRITNTRLQGFMEKVMASVPSQVRAVSEKNLPGPELHANLSGLSEQDWIDLVRDFPVVLAMLVTLRASLSINVDAEGRALEVIQNKFDALMAQEGIALVPGQLRFVSARKGVPFESFKAGAKADALIARQAKPVSSYNRNVATRWVTEDEGKMESLAAGLATVLLYAASDKKLDPLRFHTPKEYGAVLAAVVDAILGYASILRAA